MSAVIVADPCNAGEVMAEAVETAPRAVPDFAAFVADYRERAVRLAWKLCNGDQAAAEDVAQDAFVAALRALPGFRGDAELSTWFYAILVRQARAWRRRNALRNALRWPFGANPEPQTAQQPDAGAPALRKRIGEALEELSMNQREAFVLVHLEGLTLQQAAEATGRPIGTLKTHLHRALAHLRVALADEVT